MRAVLLMLAACGGAAVKPAPVPTIYNAPMHTCGEAAQQLENATRDLREPEQSILATMRAHCMEDRWADDAIACFAKMGEDDLGACAGKLDDPQREAMFGAFASTIPAAIAKLRALHVNIPDCDHLIKAMIGYLACDKAPFAKRVELANNAEDLWALPEKLPPDAAARMATVCNHSDVELQAQFGESGCMP